MIIDANADLPEVMRADVCVCGAGPAGITLARSLARRNLTVLLLEGGGESLSDESQDQYVGTTSGVPYFALDETRLRFFGGSSNHWTGHCGELDAKDFKAWDHAPLSGWPIAKSDLDPYAAEAREILDLAAAPPRPEPMPVESPGFESWALEESPPTLFAQKFRDEIRASERLTLVLNCSVLDIRLNDEGTVVTHLICGSTGAPERRMEMHAEHFALCLGGIENPRILLNSDSQQPAGIGNAHDLVGRFFSEHPHAEAGEARLPRSVASHFVSPSEAFIEERETLNFGLRVYTRDGDMAHNPLRPSTSLSAPRQVACRIPRADALAARLRDDLLYCDAMLWVMCEQSLSAENRVTLIDERDVFGLRRANLHWSFSELDWHTMEAAVIGYGEYLAQHDLGRARLHPWLIDRDTASEHMSGGHHHMCTTRMSASPTSGVVDANCRVHGVRNLFIGGSSVFATGGHINPTFTIIQLSLRLGDQLARLT